MINVEKQLQLEGREEQKHARENPRYVGPRVSSRDTRQCLRRQRLSAGGEERDGGSFATSQL